MGLFGKLFGRKSAGHIIGRMKMELAKDGLRHPELLHILIQDIRKGHEEAIPQIVRRMGNAFRHHAGMSQADGRAYLDHPFMQSLIEVHTLECYKLGYSLGSQIRIGQADAEYQKEIGILCQEQVEEMKAEARQTIRDEKVIECFIITCKEAFDIGASDGAA
ncbi:hypothetical protein [Marinicrinis lubricantis]|uniref:Uncharacterized protein n=1 Tax=Marinicrinis lubricantis TaxID=2086470 RepID=A0ABW1IPD4_9BACL